MVSSILYRWCAFRHLLPAGDEQLGLTSMFEPVSISHEGACFAPHVPVSFRRLLPAGDEQLRLTSLFEPGEVPTCICTWQPHWELPTAFVELRQRLAGPVAQLVERAYSQVSSARITAC